VNFFKNKRILIGVSGGIAAYKAVILCSILRKAGAKLKIVLTENAQKFVTKLTFESVSGFPVYVSMWEKQGFDIDHISLKDFADITIIVPATANIIGKAACGICDDLLSTVLIGLKTPVFVVPAMNSDMYQNNILQQNIQKLSQNGFYFMEPCIGNLACGVVGKGKMPEPEEILEFIENKLNFSENSSQKTIMITLGATREYFDRARFLSNPSTGKMGSAIIDELINNNFNVIAVCGHISENIVINKKALCINVVSAIDMEKAVEENIKKVAAFISCAAVSDFRPEFIFDGKLKKQNADLNNIKFVKNPDILKNVSAANPDILMIGFAAETDNFIDNGLKKLKQKSLDMLVLNDISRKDIGFATDNNEVIIFEKNIQEPYLVKKSSKSDISKIIVKKIKEILNKN